MLGLQEVDRAQPRSGGADLTAVAAEAMGAVEHRFAATLLGVPGDWGPRGLDPGETPAYGIALLSRLPVTEWRVVPLPRLAHAGPAAARSPAGVVWVRDEPRTAVAARIEGPHGPVTVVTTHLTFIPGWNLVQLRAPGPCSARRRARRGHRGPQPRRRGAPASPAGWRAWSTGGTFPADAPRRQIDHLLGRGVVASDAVRPPPAALRPPRPLGDRGAGRLSSRVPERRSPSLRGRHAGRPSLHPRDGQAGSTRCQRSVNSMVSKKAITSTTAPSGPKRRYQV